MSNARTAVIYCRVSTWSQAKGHGLMRQMKYCNEYAAEHGHHVVACFCEIGSGGKALPIRAQAIKTAKMNNAIVLCEDLDRWTRSGPEDGPWEHGVDLVRTAPWVVGFMRECLATGAGEGK